MVIFNKYKHVMYVLQFTAKPRDRDTISQFSTESSASTDSKEPVYIAAGDIRRRLSDNLTAPKKKFEVNKQKTQEVKSEMIKRFV